MSYTKHNFQPGDKLYASQLNEMDNQIALNEENVVNFTEGLPDIVDDWLDENFSNPDSPPLDRSLNSSSSAAPADLVGELKQDLNYVKSITGEIVDLLSLITTAGAIKLSDGTPMASGSSILNYFSYSPDFIEVKEGAELEYALRTPTNYAVIAFYTTANENSYSPTNSIEGTGGVLTGKYVVPSDGYIRITTRNETAGKTANLTTYGEIDDIKSNITTLQTNVGALQTWKTTADSNITNLFDDSNDIYKSIFSLIGDATINGYIKNNGSLATHNNYGTTDYIPIKNGDTFLYNIAHGSELPIISFYSSKSEESYDSTKSVIGSTNYATGTYTATANGYVRFTFLKTKTESYVIFDQTIADNVVKFIKTNVIDILPPDNDVNHLNILCMGDSIFGNDGEIPSHLNNWCGSCINGAFGGTRVSVRGSGDFKYFDGVNLVTALTTQTWTDQDTAAEALSSEYPWITGRLAGLKEVDMSSVDVIIMDWGTNDYTASQTIETILEAYNSVIDMFQTTYPTIRLLITTPIWRYWGTESDNENGDNKVYNTSTLKEIALAIEQNAKDKRISAFNAYQNIPLSYATASSYYDAGDTTHLNNSGNKIYAGYLMGKLRTMY